MTALSQILKLPRNKYRAKRTTLDGITFDSKREAIRYAALKMEQVAGRITHLALQPSFDLKVNGELICRYRGDFIYFRDGKRILEDVKGVKTRDYIIKKKLMRAIYSIEVVEVA